MTEDASSPHESPSSERHPYGLTLYLPGSALGGGTLALLLVQATWMGGSRLFLAAAGVFSGLLFQLLGEHLLASGRRAPGHLSFGLGTTVVVGLSLSVATAMFYHVRPTWVAAHLTLGLLHLAALSSFRAPTSFR